MTKGHTPSKRSKSGPGPAVVPGEMPVFSELQRRGWVIPMPLGVKKKPGARPKAKKAR